MFQTRKIIAKFLALLFVSMVLSPIASGQDVIRDGVVYEKICDGGSCRLVPKTIARAAQLPAAVVRTVFHAPIKRESCDSPELIEIAQVMEPTPDPMPNYLPTAYEGAPSVAMVFKPRLAMRQRMMHRLSNVRGFFSRLFRR